MSDLVRARFLVTGRVQGVSFRQYTVDEARGLGVRGWVRNLPDGRVEAEVEGERAAVEALLRACRRGPPAARGRGGARSPGRRTRATSGSFSIRW